MYRSLGIFVLFAFSASALSIREPERVDPIVVKCKAMHKITDELLSGMENNPEALLTNSKTRCFAACLLTENKVVKADGTLNAEPVINGLPKNIANRNKVIEAFNACANEAGANTCETAYKTAMCVSGKEAIRNMHPSN